jgi:hypothetical protein
MEDDDLEDRRLPLHAHQQARLLEEHGLELIAQFLHRLHVLRELHQPPLPRPAGPCLQLLLAPLLEAQVAVLFHDGAGAPSDPADDQERQQDPSGPQIVLNVQSRT